MSDRNVEDQLSSSIVNPDGSCYFLGARSPLLPCDVRSVLGEFLPQHPFIFFVAYGRVDTPWLYLEAFRMCVTRGPLLHHEKNFSLFRAITPIGNGRQQLLTLIVPHRLGLPVWFPPMLQELCQNSDRAELKDLCIPEVEIVPRGHRAWRREMMVPGSYTELPVAMAARLERSWTKSLDQGGVKGSG